MGVLLEVEKDVRSPLVLELQAIVMRVLGSKRRSFVNCKLLLTAELSLQTLWVGVGWGSRCSGSKNGIQNGEMVRPEILFWLNYTKRILAQDDVLL